MKIVYNDLKCSMRYDNGEMIVSLIKPYSEEVYSKALNSGFHKSHYQQLEKIIDKWQERNEIYEQINGYDWTNVKSKEILYIGIFLNLAGIIKGVVHNTIHYYFYCGSPNGYDNFFCIAEISKEEYLELFEEYKRCKNNKTYSKKTREKFSALYKNSNKRIYEGWNII